MAKFSREYLRQATSPGMFGLGVMGLGEQLGTALQGRRVRNAEMQMITLGNQALAASEQGDMEALNMRRQQLMDLLSRTSNKDARNNIINAINEINAARPATQARATTNKAKAIIKTEQALDDMKSERESLQVTDEQGQVQLSGVFTSGQDRAMQALEDRLEVMKQDANAVVEANDIRLSTRLKQLEDEQKLYTAEVKRGVSMLSQHEYGSDSYNDTAQQLKDAGLSKAVMDYEKIVMQFQTEQAELQKKLDEKRPLSAEEQAYMRERGYRLSDSDYENRKQYNTLVNGENQARMAIALRALTSNEGDAAKAYANLALDTFRSIGDTQPLWFDDLKEMIDDELTEKDYEIIYGMAEGKTESEIQNVVAGYLRNRFKTHFANMETDVKNKRKTNQAMLDITEDLLLSAKNPDGSFKYERLEDGSVDRSKVPPIELRQAEEEAERRVNPSIQPSSQLDTTLAGAKAGVVF